MPIVVLNRKVLAYLENADTARPKSSNVRAEKKSVSFHTVPPLCQRARPVHEFVPVDFFLPGCPPPSDAIFFLISELLAGRTPDMSGRTRFGA